MARRSCCTSHSRNSTPVRRPALVLRAHRCGSSAFTVSDGVGTRAHARFGSAGRSPSVATRRPSRQVGVPAARTKTQLFMIVVGRGLAGRACCSRSASTRSRPTPATVRSSSTSSPPSSAARCSPAATARRSAAAIGACIVAMATLQGIPFARWNSDWRYLFLGVTLLTGDARQPLDPHQGGRHAAMTDHRPTRPTNRGQTQSEGGPLNGRRSPARARQHHQVLRQHHRPARRQRPTSTPAR